MKKYMAILPWISSPQDYRHAKAYDTVHLRPTHALTD